MTEKDPNIDRIEARMMHIVNQIDKLAEDVKANPGIELHKMDPNVLASWCSTMIGVGEKAQGIVDYQVAQAAAILLKMMFTQEDAVREAARQARDN
jgi:hypothetical protein